MKRYFLFWGDDYYPSGGWDDFGGDFDTVAEAEEMFKADCSKRSRQWYHIVDTETMDKVKEGTT